MDLLTRRDGLRIAVGLIGLIVPGCDLGDDMQGTGPGRFGYPTDAVTDRDGNFYVSEYGENDRIQVFSPEGGWLRQWGGHGLEPGEFLRPRALAIDDRDRIYVADSCNHRIQVFDTQGK